MKSTGSAAKSFSHMQEPASDFIVAFEMIDQKVAINCLVPAVFATTPAHNLHAIQAYFCPQSIIFDTTDFFHNAFFPASIPIGSLWQIRGKHWARASPRQSRRKVTARSKVSATKMVLTNPGSEKSSKAKLIRVFPKLSIWLNFWTSRSATCGPRKNPRHHEKWCLKGGMK